MKFIHAGDLHLGNAFLDLPQLPEWVLEHVQSASMWALESLIDTAIRAQVDVVLFPGDIYDTHMPNPHVQWLFQQQMERLSAAHIPVVLGFGNHDYTDTMDGPLHFPKNVTVLTNQVQTVRLVMQNGENVAVSGFSYPKRHLKKSLVAAFPVRQADEDFHIGMYHGAQDHGDYAQFTLADLNRKHYQYWALGHIHVRQTLQAEPFIGYSGNLQGLNRTEIGLKGFYLVQSNQQGQLIPEFQACAPVIWTQVHVQLTEQMNWSEVIDRIRHQIQRQNKFQLVEIDVEQVPHKLAAGLQSVAFMNQLSERAQATDNFWIHRVEVRIAGQGSQLMELGTENWQAQKQGLVTTAHLEDLGLKLVDDLELYDYFQKSQTQQDIGRAMDEVIQAIQRGQWHAD
ncbi:exonuclease SbcCD subunit D [Weissella kandleri]|uniref:metallophosphoesterase family protein n=1 Tax=Weissella kandleri TaxID=1616 RepID=UPI00387E6EFB